MKVRARLGLSTRIALTWSSAKPRFLMRGTMFSRMWA